ncbi:hypothetical protein Goshw_009952 [Gossypium schwendimanii]|uniref:Nucleoprotein TPR/MLP1-2 domain-containing protein n=1 Tax=Gossypium schwendimanii TaxID=34291 RepID=A0A7J9KRB7_GOSSC|nr:hypothetical protein [Gossypium schwendimanii]
MTKDEIEKLKEEAKVNRDHMLQYKNIAQANEDALKQMELAHENFKIEAEKLKKSLEAELVSLRERVSELENESSLKSEEVASATAGKEEALSSVLAEITSLKEETAVKSSQIMALEIQISSMKENLENEHEKWRAAQANYERQVCSLHTNYEPNVFDSAWHYKKYHPEHDLLLYSNTICVVSALLCILFNENCSGLCNSLDCFSDILFEQVILQSETIQELTKTSQELALLQEEASELRKLADAHKSENAELKARWEMEKSVLEESRKEAEKKYDELNEQNKILHSRIEAMHIQFAEKDRGSALAESSVPDSHGDSGLQNVINYLRRTKQIAETEISLLKQEKLRLQSQLENALKAEENAKATLNAERANSRAVLMTEDEIKSLQHQIREMNLLRESNMQLREENKHNFEECQKLREVAHKHKIESEALESQLMERQFEVEASKKEIEKHLTEREILEKRVSELLERCRNIDVEDYNRLKNDVLQKEENLKEKDAQIEEITNLLSKKQDIISKLEQDLANSKLELNEKDKKLNDILQQEANLKSDIEKQKKLVVQFKRRAESFAKEKEQLSRENLKLVEELKQGRRSGSDITGDQVMKEKEEKDTRIQILEKTVERQREELKKEKDEHQNEKAKRIKCERTIMEAVRKTEKGKTTVLGELEKYQLSVKRISEELEKLKHAEGNLPQGTSVVQLLSGTISDDHASSYLSAAEDFEKVARSILNELGTGSISGDVPAVDNSTPVLTGDFSENRGFFSSFFFFPWCDNLISVSGTVVPDQGPVIASSTVPVTSHQQPAKTSEERRSILPKTNTDTRKTGRRLVRPRFVKPEEPQGDVEMSEAISHDVDAQGTLTSQNQQSVRKRLASATSELSEDLPVPGETSSDVVVPALKKSKGPDSGQEAAEGQAAALSENVGCPQVTDEAYDNVGDVTQGSNEELVDVEKEEADTMEENLEESKEPQVDGTNEVGLQENKNNISDEILEKPSGNEVVADEDSKNPAEQDNVQPVLETESEREEGELVPEVAADTEGGNDAHNVVGSSEVGDRQAELVSSPLASPSRVDDEALVTAAEGDNSPDAVNDEKNEEGYIGEESVAEGSEKSNDGNEQSVVETDPMPEAAAAAVATSGTNESGTTSGTPEGEVSKNIGSSSGAAAAEAEDVKQMSPISGTGSGSGSSATSTLVNLQERARERAMLRQAGVLGSTTSGRGRGRVAVRARGARGRSARGGRAGGGPQNSDQQ